MSHKEGKGADASRSDYEGEALSRGNDELSAAQRAKNDEFYTRREEIEAEMAHYRGAFRGKSVYLNCDDYRTSCFWEYFSDNFRELGLKSLVSTGYTTLGSPEEPPSMSVQTPVGVTVTPLVGDGDFRSAECVHLLVSADIVVTNPPFSLFRPFMQLLMEHGKKFVILGNLNAVTYKEIWPYIQAGEVWFGPSIRSGDRPFRVPQSYPLAAAGCWVDDENQKWIRVKGVRWFTNLEHEERRQPLEFTSTFCEDEYPQYTNFEAVEVSRTLRIPTDYTGLMGVPITFLDKHNPDQFEIVGSSRTMGTPISEVAVKGTYQPGGPRFYLPLGNGRHRRLYERVVIRNRKPALAAVKTHGPNQ